MSPYLAMNIIPVTRPACLVAALAWLLSVPAVSGADGLVRTQTIQLTEGWNSVHLAVTPGEADPAQVFANLPVEIVASFFYPAGPVQFINDPGSSGWNKENWAVWYAPHRADAFLSSLFEIHGNRSYLIRVTRDATWTVEGTVTRERVRWRSDSYNHVGFSLDRQSPPTFAQFFAGGTAHPPDRIYRLVQGRWTRLANPAGTLMKDGEASWVYCHGSSDFQGPLDVELLHERGLLFGADGRASLTFHNRSPSPVEVVVESPSGSDPLPLSFVVRLLGDRQIRNAFVPLTPRLDLGAVEPDQRRGLFLELHREQMTAPLQRGLFRISTDVGAEYWIPVVGHRLDSQPTP